jgi:hypothetical protein
LHRHQADTQREKERGRGREGRGERKEGPKRGDERSGIAAGFCAPIDMAKKENKASKATTSGSGSGQGKAAKEAENEEAVSGNAAIDIKTLEQEVSPSGTDMFDLP